MEIETEEDKIAIIDDKLNEKDILQDVNKDKKTEVEVDSLKNYYKNRDN